MLPLIHIWISRNCFFSPKKSQIIVRDAIRDLLEKRPHCTMKPNTTWSKHNFYDSSGIWNSHCKSDQPWFESPLRCVLVKMMRAIYFFINHNLYVLRGDMHGVVVIKRVPSRHSCIPTHFSPMKIRLYKWVMFKSKRWKSCMILWLGIGYMPSKFYIVERKSYIDKGSTQIKSA